MTNGFDRLLRESLGAGASANEGGECLDATLLAAWFDGTLPHAERLAVQKHAASCSRCQATIAALVRTGPPPPRVWWHAPAVRWLVPVAIAAASLVLWISVLRPGRPETLAPTAMSSVARREPPAPGSSAAIPPAEPERRAASTRAADSRATAKAQAQDASAARERRPMTGGAANIRETPARTAGAEGTSTAPQTEPLRERVEVPPPAPQSPGAATARSSAPSPVLAPQADAAAKAAAAPSAVETVTARSADAAQPLSRNIPESVAIVQPVGPSPAIVSLDPAVRWRVAGPGRVERSADSGVTWQAQSTGATVVIAAGMAPSANVCWLVGMGGAVLKTADGGQTWTRLSVPGDADLVSVVANDGNVATVTAAGGRQLRTTDGGRSWR
jgi:hypothetical protein